jgi:hypothetical protein
VAAEIPRYPLLPKQSKKTASSMDATRRWRSSWDDDR